MNKFTYIFPVIVMLAWPSFSMEEVSFDYEHEVERYYGAGDALIESPPLRRNDRRQELSVLTSLLQERRANREISGLAWEIIAKSELPHLENAFNVQTRKDDNAGGGDLAWNLFQYERLADATLAIIKEIRLQVREHGDEVISKKSARKEPSYQYQLRAAYVALMLTLEDFENKLNIKYRDKDPFPNSSMLEAITNNVQTWGNALYDKVKAQVYSDDENPPRSEGKLSKAELARRYHLARNGLSSMFGAWTKTGWDGAAAVKNVAHSLASPRTLVQDAKETFRELRHWFSQTNPMNLMKTSLALLKNGSGQAFGILEFAREYPILGRDLAANMMLFYRTLVMDRSGFWGEVLGDFEAIYQFKEAENLVNDLLLGTEDYLYSSVDIFKNPLPPQILVVSQMADWAPYAAGAYIGLTVETGANGWMSTLIQSIPVYGPIAAKVAAKVACAGMGVAIVHLQKKAAAKISREHEIMANMLIHTFRDIWGGERDIKKLARNAFAYVGAREAILVCGTVAKLAKDGRLTKEFLWRALGVYVWDQDAGGPLPRKTGARVINILHKAIPTAVTGASSAIGYWGFGTLWKYFIEGDPDYSLALLQAAPWITLGAAAVALPLVVHYLRDCASHCCASGQRLKLRKQAQRIRQIEDQKAKLPTVCAKSDIPKVQDMSKLFEKASQHLTQEDLAQIASEDLTAEQMFERLISMLILIVDEQDENAQRFAAEVAKHNPEFVELKKRLDSLVDESKAEYLPSVDSSISMFRGRKKQLDRFEKEIVDKMKLLRNLPMIESKRDAIKAERTELIAEIKLALDKVRVRQFREQLWNEVKWDDTGDVRMNVPRSGGEMQEVASEESPLIPRNKNQGCGIL